MIKKLKALYFRLLLPYENPEHPLYSDGSIQYDNELEQQISDFVDEELDFQDLIGPNYSRQMGDRPTQYEKWGNKYYRKAK